MNRVVFISASSRMSGVEFSTLYLLRAMDQSEWESIVVCPEEGDLPERLRESGRSVLIVPMPRTFSVGIRIFGRVFPNPGAYLVNAAVLAISVARLKRSLSVLHPSLVVTKGMSAHFYGGAAARSLGLPCVWHLQDRVTERYGPIYPWLVSVAARRWATRVIADAGSIARQLDRWYPPDRIDVIWNAVDTDLFSPAVDGNAVRSEWRAYDGTLLIGVVARLTPWKGQHLLLEAFARLATEFPAVRIVLVGSPMFDNDKYLHRLQSNTLRSGTEDRVVFAGFRRDMPQVFAALDIVVHTSVEKDSTPLAVVSALAAGRPVLCSAVDGTAELFDGENGILFAVGDPRDLESKLRSLLNDHELRGRLGKAARLSAVNQLSIQRHSIRCMHSFQMALNGPISCMH